MKELASLLLPAEHRRRFLEEVKAVLSPEQFETVRAVFEGSAELLGIVDEGKLSIRRLHARVFGPKTEKGHRLGEPAPGEAWGATKAPRTRTPIASSLHRGAPDPDTASRTEGGAEVPGVRPGEAAPAAGAGHDPAAEGPTAGGRGGP